MKNKILLGILTIVCIVLVIVTTLTVMIFLNQQDLKEITEAKDPIVNYEEKENKVETSQKSIKIEQEVTRASYLEDECFVQTQVNVYSGEHFENIEWSALDKCSCDDAEKIKKDQYKDALPTVKKLKEVFKKYAKNK